MRVFSILMPGQTRTRVTWELMRVGKREFAWEFSQFSCPGQTRTRVAWALRSESLHKSFLKSHVPVKNENKSCMRVEKREFAWEFTQLSYPSLTRTRVAWELRSESLHESFLNSHAQVKREQELHEMRVDKSWEARVSMRVSQFSCPGQTRTSVAWELRSESLLKSFLKSHVPVKREQELHESWWELRSESLHESLLNSHIPV
jgi:hypothetical protein